MEVEMILKELEALGSERTKKSYLQQGAHEPLFGVATGAMKPIAKKVKGNQKVAEELYATGNYDAMYLAGMIADVRAMTEGDFDRWIKGAYFYMISDYIVAVSLAETEFAMEVSDRWIVDGRELYGSAGYSCYCWLLGNRKDEEFDQGKLSEMLDLVKKTIHISEDRVKYAMNLFVVTIGVSYLPLHEKAVEVANAIGMIEISDGKGKHNLPVASVEIQKAVQKDRLGFKRRNVRC